MADIWMGGGVRAKTAPGPLVHARLTAIVAYAAMMLMLLAPALLNGFPLIFPDTGGYLDRPILGTLEMGRSALYGAFLYPGVAFSFWPNIILQAAMMVWLIALTLREGWQVRFVPVNHRHRTAGQSKYTNFGRLLVSGADLLGVLWLLRRHHGRAGAEEL